LLSDQQVRGEVAKSVGWEKEKAGQLKKRERAEGKHSRSKLGINNEFQGERSHL
jgi:hypothetical protein